MTMAGNPTVAGLERRYLSTSDGSLTKPRGRARRHPEHDPEKRVAVFRKDHAQSRIQSAMAIQPNLVAL
jgi:hypothetical protein